MNTLLKQKTAHIPITHHLIIGICAVIFISVCSRSSPLYPFNNWDDTNCFFTVGKSMFQGLVPYRDLIEQKGPLLYFLYGLAWLISNDTFLGGYLLEIIAAYCYLLCALHILKHLVPENTIILIPIIALVTYVSKAFDQGGSAEELCLPLITLSLLLMLKYSTSQSWNALLIGCIAGCVFWIKFSLIGIYIGWYAYIFTTCIRTHNIKHLWITTCYIAIGTIISTIPWIFYFGIHHAIKDWLTIYLYDNLFVYTQTSNTSSNLPIIGNLLIGLLATVKTNLLTFILILLGAILLHYSKNKEIAQITATSVIATFVLIYIGGRHFQYYSLILTPFLAPYLGIIYQSCKAKINPTRKYPVPIWIITVICLCGSLLTPNLYFMRQSKTDLAQYQFKNIMQQSGQNITLLNYGFLDGGFYTVTNTVPNCKAFCDLNMPLEELYTLQEYYVKHGLCDYIITKARYHQSDHTNFTLYECIAECDTDDPSYGIDTYRLYRLKA